MTDFFFYDTLSYLSLGFSILSAIIGLYIYSRLNQRMRWFLFFILFSILFDIMVRAFSTFGIRNIALLNIYTLGEFAMLGAFFCVFLKTNKHYLAIRIFLFTTFLFLAYVIFKQGINFDLNRIAMGVEAVVFIFLSVGSFYTMLTEMEFESPFENPLFWINAAVLIYFSGAFFTFIFSSVKQDNVSIWIIHNLVHFVFTTLIFLSFWKARKI